MRYKLTFAVGTAVGYVLGTRAGRERYEQLKRSARRVAENPSVQETAGVLQAQASGLADRTRRKVGDKLGQRIPRWRRGRLSPDTDTKVTHANARPPGL